MDLGGLLNPFTSNVAAIFLAIVMARGAVHKIRDETFVGTLEEYRILPPSLVTPGKYLLIAAEGLATALLVLPASRGYGAALAAALLALYAAAIAINLVRGRYEIDCGCGGPGELISWSLAARNAVLILLAVPAALGASSEGPSLLATYGPGAAVVTVFAVVTLYLALMLFEGIAGRNGAIALLAVRGR